MVKVISVFKETEETELGVFDSQKDALLAIANDIEWEEGDDPHDYVFRIEECDEDYEEPYDIDDDCGFDPYCGCYTYDCQGVATMRDLLKVVIWFFVINFSICNHIWTEPVSYWWVIEIIVLIISILMVDKPVKKQYYNYRKKKREVFTMRIDVAITCPFCGEDHAVEVNLAQYEAWQNGELIQNAMPDLTPTEREQLISGLCPKCQAEMFGE